MKKTKQKLLHPYPLYFCQKVGNDKIMLSILYWLTKLEKRGLHLCYPKLKRAPEADLKGAAAFLVIL